MQAQGRCPRSTKASVAGHSGVSTDHAGGNEIPFLRYYAYQWIPVPGENPRPEATLPLVPPIDVFEARRVARVDVTLIARPLGKSDKTKGVNLSDQIMARHSDPNLAKWDSNSLPDPR